MVEFTSELYAWINAFEGWVNLQYSEVQALDLVGIREEMATLHAKVCSLVERSFPFFYNHLLHIDLRILICLLRRI